EGIAAAGAGVVVTVAGGAVPARAGAGGGDEEPLIGGGAAVGGVCEADADNVGGVGFDAAVGAAIEQKHVVVGVVFDGAVGARRGVGGNDAGVGGRGGTERVDVGAVKPGIAKGAVLGLAGGLPPALAFAVEGHVAPGVAGVGVVGDGSESVAQKSHGIGAALEDVGGDGMGGGGSSADPASGERDLAEMRVGGGFIHRGILHFLVVDPHGRNLAGIEEALLGPQASLAIHVAGIAAGAGSAAGGCVQLKGEVALRKGGAGEAMMVV